MSSLFNAMAVYYNEPGTRGDLRRRGLAARFARRRPLRYDSPLAHQTNGLCPGAGGRVGDVRLDVAPVRPTDRQRPPRTEPIAPATAESVWAYFFGQKKVIEKTTLPARRWPRFVSAIGSKYHFVIFWGFLIITIATGETLCGGAARPSRSRGFLGDASASRSTPRSTSAPCWCCW